MAGISSGDGEEKKAEVLRTPNEKSKVDGSRGRGKPRKQWEDDLEQWTGEGLGQLKRKAMGREEWRKNVRTAYSG